MFKIQDNLIGYIYVTISFEEKSQRKVQYSMKLAYYKIKGVADDCVSMKLPVLLK